MASEEEGGLTSIMKKGNTADFSIGRQSKKVVLLENPEVREFTNTESFKKSDLLSLPV
jgi:hypothetical protein